MGHMKVVHWLHNCCDAWDDSPDHAGNYCVDLCRMARTSRHDAVAQYLRQHGSRDVIEWCHTLGVSLNQVRLDSVSSSASVAAGAASRPCAVNQVVLRRAYCNRCAKPTRTNTGRYLE